MVIQGRLENVLQDDSLVVAVLIDPAKRGFIKEAFFIVLHRVHKRVRGPKPVFHKTKPRRHFFFLLLGKILKNQLFVVMGSELVGRTYVELITLGFFVEKKFKKKSGSVRGRL